MRHSSTSHAYIKIGKRIKPTHHHIVADTGINLPPQCACEFVVPFAFIIACKCHPLEFKKLVLEKAEAAAKGA